MMLAALVRLKHKTNIKETLKFDFQKSSFHFQTSRIPFLLIFKFRKILSHFFEIYFVKQQKKSKAYAFIYTFIEVSR